MNNPTEQQLNFANMYLMTNSQFFPSDKMYLLKQRLEQLPESRQIYVQSVELKNPTNILLVSIFLGGLGIDRFMMGDIGLGIGKLITAGGCGIWTFVDWFLVSSACGDKNFQNLMMIL